RALATGRLVLAAGITLGILPYAWGRALIIGLLTGSPEPRFAAMLAAGILATMVLTFHLAPAFSGQRLASLIVGGVALGWVVEMGTLIFLRAGDLVPRAYVLLL